MDGYHNVGYIHQTAEVSPQAHIGDGTKVWNQAQIREHAHIGKDCVISKNSYIDCHVILGDRVKVQNSVNVYHGVDVGDDVFLGPSMTFTNDLYPRSDNPGWKITQTRVCKGASICANCTIVCGVTIGEYAMIGAGSVVVRDVPRQALMVGNPAKQIGWVCECGNRLSADMLCPVCARSYPDLRIVEV